MRFVHRQPIWWTGHYGRVPGKEPAFHIVTQGDQFTCVLQRHADDLLAVCPMEDSEASRRLAIWVVACKAANGGGNGGGSFLINEFGQVLVPTGPMTRLFVGTWEGPMRFTDPLHSGCLFDLTDDSPFKNGDDWDCPYVGSHYVLSAGNEIYRYRDEANSTEKQYAPRQDRELIQALRWLRPWNGLRFLALPGGLVITKVEDSPGKWKPKYVGRIDFDRWFEREES